MQHVQHGVGIAGVHDACAGYLLSGLEHGRRHQFAFARKHGIGMGKLEQADRQTVAITHGGLFDRAPGFEPTQSPAYGSGERQIGLLAEPDPAEHLPHLARLQPHGNLDGAHVARLLDHLVDCHQALGMGITDG